MINDKTLIKLQYSEILSGVSNFAVSSVAKKMIMELTPADSCDKASLLLAETAQAADLFRFESSFDLSVDDMTEISSLSRIGSTLSQAQLLAVMRLLRTSRCLQKSLSADYGVDTSILQAKAFALYSDKNLEDDIDFSIISEEEINDKASDELYAVRKKIKAINSDIKQKLQSYTGKGELGKYLQDSIVTIRSGRYVIPVKQEYKSFVNGIVHDQSATGATVFIEPMAVVQLNNALRTAVLEEKAEIQRILQAFTDRVGAAADRILAAQRTICEVDVIFSKVKYGLSLKCSCPNLNNNGFINLKNARHPLLDGKKVVPVSLKLGGEFDIMVITGPNTGGKTVTLKTAGLMCAMAMTGLFVPCSEGSETSYFDDIFCDIGDEQSIEQNLSTFSGHITNLRDILNRCGKESLVLIDEVGAGTEPNEGAALALAVTEFLRRSGARCVITTHYGKLKEYSLVTSGVENASMEFDPETFEPTYRLITGVPGSSNAIAIASKLGMRGEVIEIARDNLSEEKVSFEKVLQNAETIRKQYEAKLAEAESEKKRLAEEALRAARLNDSLQAERNKFLADSRAEAKKILERASEEASEMLTRIKEILDGDELSDKSLFAARAAAKSLREIKLDDEDDGDEVVFTGEKVDYSKLRQGDVVFSKKLGVQVRISELRGPSRIEVRCGGISTTVKADDLYYCKTETNKSRRRPVSAKGAKTEINSRSIENEINVIGQTVDEAVANVGAFIDSAVLAGLNCIWVIHGMGTGRLREGLHRYFSKHPNIDSFRLGKFGEGESGVTVVTLK